MVADREFLQRGYHLDTLHAKKRKKGKKETPELLEPLVGERSATKGIERFNTSRMYLPFEMAELEW